MLDSTTLNDTLEKVKRGALDITKKAKETPSSSAKYQSQVIKKGTVRTMPVREKGIRMEPASSQQRKTPMVLALVSVFIAVLFISLAVYMAKRK